MVTREEIFLTTKVWSTWYSEGRVMASVKKMLKQSGFEYFDLVLLHWPLVFADHDTERFPCKSDTGTIALGTRTLNEVYQELETVNQCGLTKAIGVSNFNAKQIDDLMSVAKIKPVTNQVECHLYFAQFELQKHCAQYNIFITAYCPLGTGGNRPNSPKLLQDETLISMAKKYDKTPAQIALKWLIQRCIIVIPKSVHKDRLQTNIDVFSFEISENDCRTLDAMNRPNGRIITFDYLGTKDAPGYPF